MKEIINSVLLMVEEVQYITIYKHYFSCVHSAPTIYSLWNCSSIYRKEVSLSEKTISMHLQGCNHLC